jgi:hypothetical protein
MVAHIYEKVPEDHEDHHAESTPFLGDNFDGSIPTSPSKSEIDSIAEKRAQRFRTKVTILITLLIVAVDLPSVMFHSSLVRILESIYCKQHYAAYDPTKIPLNGTIPEELCKIESVQANLSSLRGWNSFWGHLPGKFFKYQIVISFFLKHINQNNRFISCNSLRYACR